uniref:VWFA domain-containing protein n=1 Tax=viral metagenome TaxID=1070528 RepID=A0A6C0DJV3_9ZZZZ
MSIIQESFILLHNNENNKPVIKYPNYETSSFGVLNIKIKKTKKTTMPTCFVFTIDRTGSMSEFCGNGRITRMDYIKQSFQSMMNYFAKQETHIIVRVHAFNENVDVLVDNILITPDNVNSIIEKIKNLEPDGSTNIANAITKANEALVKYSTDNPTHQICHIFMTDGEPTSGEHSADVLAGMVNENFTNIFIGAGFGHNAYILRKLSEKKNGEYLFIDNMENATLVYSEPVHRFLYPGLKDIRLEVENGKIYDWKTNKWVSVLEEPDLVSEVDKYYHLVTDTPNELDVSIYGIEVGVAADSADEIAADLSSKLLDIVEVMPDLIDFDTNKIVEPNDLSKYMFKQLTQELLFKAKSKEYNYNEIYYFKELLRNVFKKMRNYMRSKGLLDDPFMKQLCNDISIIYSTIGKSNGIMFAMSRSCSQGRQQSYNTNSININDTMDFNTPILNRPPLLKRSNYIPDIPESVNEDDEDNNLFDSNQGLFGLKNGMRRMNDFNSINQNQHDFDEIKRAIVCDDFDNMNNLPPLPGMTTPTNSNSNRNVYFPNMPDIADLCSNLNILKIICQGDSTILEEETVETVIIEDDLESFIPIEDTTSCYTTPSALSTIRSMSQC